MALKSCTLLFVEDDPQIQELIQTILQDDVKVLYQAYNGKEGLELYLEKSPDIIVTDINMPLLDGLQMSRKIKEIDQNQPILIISAHDEREILLDAINFGIDGFIVKPVEIEQLHSKLDQIAKNLQNKTDTENTILRKLEKKQKEEMQGLYNLAHYDVLTNIPNRYLFNQKIDQAIIRSDQEHTQFALFFIDLDDFKYINDTYGHKAGDHVLVTLANNITKVIRKEDTLARIGGDEFALIVENVTDKITVETLAKKIIDAVSTPIHFKDKTITMSCSIGISIYPQDTRCKEELIHFADLAMYKIKSRGKSYFSFYKDD